MMKEELKNWTLSDYNIGSNCQLDYYINERRCDAGDKAYLYSHEEDRILEMKIVKTIRRLDDMEYYDSLGENALLEGESKYQADTSAEFITDNNSYLVWFKYV